MPSPTEITQAQLFRLIGTPTAPIIIDVRIDEDFALDPRSIPGSQRHSHQNIDDIVPQLQGNSVVVSCHQGKKLSQGFAAILRNQGIRAETLENGHVGWQEAGLPLIPSNQLSNVDSLGRTVWVTRHRPKIDRIACPWLIKRFIDRNAQFLYVAPNEVENVAEKFNAFAFDIDGTFYSHRGDNCTFDTMLDEFNLNIEALRHLAKIIRGADTDQLQLIPQSAGLLAASLGFSRMYKDDLEQLEKSLPLYDAMYRWCRDATSEKHDWPMHQKKDIRKEP